MPDKYDYVHVNTAANKLSRKMAMIMLRLAGCKAFSVDSIEVIKLRRRSHKLVMKKLSNAMYGKFSGGDNIPEHRCDAFTQGFTAAIEYINDLTELWE